MKIENIVLITMWFDLQIDLIQIQLQSIVKFSNTFISYISFVVMSLVITLHVCQASLLVWSNKTSVVGVTKYCSELCKVKIKLYF